MVASPSPQNHIPQQKHQQFIVNNIDITNYIYVNGNQNHHQKNPATCTKGEVLLSIKNSRRRRWLFWCEREQLYAPRFASPN